MINQIKCSMFWSFFQIQNMTAVCNWWKVTAQRMFNGANILCSWWEFASFYCSQICPPGANSWCSTILMKLFGGNQKMFQVKGGSFVQSKGCHSALNPSTKRHFTSFFYSTVSISLTSTKVIGVSTWSRHWRESKKVNSRVEREIWNSDLEFRE